MRRASSAMRLESSCLPRPTKSSPAVSLGAATAHQRGSSNVWHARAGSRYSRSCGSACGFGRGVAIERIFAQRRQTVCRPLARTIIKPRETRSRPWPARVPADTRGKDPSRPRPCSRRVRARGVRRRPEHDDRRDDRRVAALVLTGSAPAGGAVTTSWLAWWGGDAVGVLVGDAVPARRGRSRNAGHAVDRRRGESRRHSASLRSWSPRTSHLSRICRLPVYPRFSGAHADRACASAGAARRPAWRW